MHDDYRKGYNHLAWGVAFSLKMLKRPNSHTWTSLWWDHHYFQGRNKLRWSSDKKHAETSIEGGFCFVLFLFFE